MFPIVPLLIAGAGFWWLRSRKIAESASSSDGLSSILTGSKPSESVEFKRRRELEKLLGGKRTRPKPGASAPPNAAPPTTLPAAPQGFDACLDEGIPPEFVADLRGAYESKNLTPADFAQIAEVLVGQSFPKAAACFTSLGMKRGEEMAAQVQKDGGLKYTIVSGDTPVGIARYYTNDAGKFRELGKLNESVLGKLKTTGGVSNYPGWKPGVEILIPAAWKPLEKPFKAKPTA